MPDVLILKPIALYISCGFLWFWVFVVVIVVVVVEVGRFGCSGHEIKAGLCYHTLATSGNSPDMDFKETKGNVKPSDFFCLVIPKCPLLFWSERIKVNSGPERGGKS